MSRKNWNRVDINLDYRASNAPSSVGERDSNLAYHSSAGASGAAADSAANDDVSELRRNLPNAPQAKRFEEQLQSLPDRGPFKLHLNNIDFNATPEMARAYFRPLEIVNMNLALPKKGSGFIELASKEDMRAALEKHETCLGSRPLYISIPSKMSGGGGAGGWGGMGGGASSGKWRSDREPISGGGGGGASSAVDEDNDWRRDAEPTRASNFPQNQQQQHYRNNTSRGGGRGGRQSMHNAGGPSNHNATNSESGGAVDSAGGVDSVSDWRSSMNEATSAKSDVISTSSAGGGSGAASGGAFPTTNTWNTKSAKVVAVDSAGGAIFGDAKPVDTNKREQEIEEKMVRSVATRKASNTEQASAAADGEVEQVSESLPVQHHQKKAPSSAGMEMNWRDSPQIKHEPVAHPPHQQFQQRRGGRGGGGGVGRDDGSTGGESSFAGNWRDENDSAGTNASTGAGSRGGGGAHRNFNRQSRGGPHNFANNTSFRRGDRSNFHQSDGASASNGSATSLNSGSVGAPGGPQPGATGAAEGSAASPSPNFVPAPAPAVNVWNVRKEQKQQRESCSSSVSGSAENDQSTHQKQQKTGFPANKPDNPSTNQANHQQSQQQPEQLQQENQQQTSSAYRPPPTANVWTTRKQEREERERAACAATAKQAAIIAPAASNEVASAPRNSHSASSIDSTQLKSDLQQQSSQPHQPIRAVVSANERIEVLPPNKHFSHTHSHSYHSQYPNQHQRFGGGGYQGPKGYPKRGNHIPPNPQHSYAHAHTQAVKAPYHLQLDVDQSQQHHHHPAKVMEQQNFYQPPQQLNQPIASSKCAETSDAATSLTSTTINEKASIVNKWEKGPPASMIPQ